MCPVCFPIFFFVNDTATTGIYTLSLHDALPISLPPLGVPNRPAPLLTKTLLFLGEGSDAVIGTPRVDWGWGTKFRAYDKATGQVIWEMELPSGTTGGPMTYMLRGKQYIVVPV